MNKYQKRIARMTKEHIADTGESFRSGRVWLRFVGRSAKDSIRGQLNYMEKIAGCQSRGTMKAWIINGALRRRVPRKLRRYAVHE